MFQKFLISLSVLTGRWVAIADHLVNKKTHTNPYIVVINCADYESERKAREFIEKQVSRVVVKSKSAQKGAVELNLEIRMKSENTDFINILSEMNGVNSAVIVSYNGDYMG